MKWLGLSGGSDLAMEILATKKELELLIKETEERSLETALEADPFKDLSVSVHHVGSSWQSYSTVREQVTEWLSIVRKLREEAERMLLDDDPSVEKLTSLVEYIQREGNSVYCTMPFRRNWLK